MSRASTIDLDPMDRDIINGLQGGFPLSDTPYADVAAGLGVGEGELIARLERMLEAGVLSRFGPMYNADRLGGQNVLAAMAVPEDAFDDVADIVNTFDEVAHNYARDHALNMWFVLATEAPERVDEVIGEITAATGYPVIAMPKLEEYFVGLRFEL